MMTMLHSVWSGGGSAAGRRRSVLALGALLALVASVMIWVSPTQAQNTTPPIAIGSARVTVDATPTTAAQATLFGNQSFDPDDQGQQAAIADRGIASWRWEVVTDAYSWINLTPRNATDDADVTVTDTTTPRPNARFAVPSPALAARYGQTIEFRLTVTDNDNPAASTSTTVTFNINQGPTADIALSANVANPDDIKYYDDNGNGQRDENDEVYSVDGIIDGPGENGNADNEWDIMEGSRLILDGSGSTDPDGRPIVTAGHDWDLLFRSDDGDNDSTVTAALDAFGDSTTSPAPGAEAGDEEVRNIKKLDIAPVGELTNEGGAVTADDGTPHDPIYVYYRLTVTDGSGLSGAGNATNSAIVKIVIHDQPQDPEVEMDDIQPREQVDPEGYAKIQKGAPIPGTDQKYVILPGTTVTFTARGTDGDGGSISYSWEGARGSDVDGTISVPTAADPEQNEDISGSTATWTAPRNVEDGTSYTVTVTATDVTGRSGTHSYELVVANNQRPEAVAPGTLGGLGTFLYTVDGADGGDLVPVADNSLTRPALRPSGTQTLRGFGFDPDGPIAVFNWSELAYPTVDLGPSDADPPVVSDADPDMDPNNDLNVAVAGVGDTDPAMGQGIPVPLELPRVPVLEIDNAFSEVASFDVPEVDAGNLPKHLTVQINDTGDWDGDGCTYDAADTTADVDGEPCFENTPTEDGDDGHDAPSGETVTAVAVPIAFSVIDAYGVIDTNIVTVFIIDDPDAPMAEAGDNRQVNSGAFVRLSGILSSDPDPADRAAISFEWEYVGMVTTDPLTQDRRPITAGERAQGFVEGQWFPYDGISTVLVVAQESTTVGDLNGDGDVLDAVAVPRQVFSNHALEAASVGAGTNANGDAVTNAYPAGTNVGSLLGADGIAGTDDDGVPVDFRVLPDGDDTGDLLDDAVRGQYHPTAGGLLKNAGTSYRYSDRGRAFPYFDAPRLSHFHNVQLEFQLTVTVTGEAPDTDTIRVSVVSAFYTGAITGPDFCTGKSLGGPSTFAYDGDGDGVADTCSLRTTRRATVAIQNALETLAALNPETFSVYLHGTTAAEPGTTVVGTCRHAPRTLGDTPAQLLADSCGQGTASSPPAPVDPAVADVFFSGVITGPNYCTNASLGGPTTYAFDSDDDGVSDTCSLPYTRREAVARQNALAKFQSDDQYKDALGAACAALGSLPFGDNAGDLARDECERPDPPALGTPLPTRS